MTLATAPRRAARRMSSEDTLALWREYRRTNDRSLRDRLVLTFAPLVKYIVYKKLREMPARCEAEDFIACGLEALIHSIERYDPEKGATLEQYAWTRIHGAVLVFDAIGLAKTTEQMLAATRPGTRMVPALGEDGYGALLREADVMVGNSSSGLIEAPSFGLPVLGGLPF